MAFKVLPDNVCCDSENYNANCKNYAQTKTCLQIKSKCYCSKTLIPVVYLYNTSTFQL